MSNGCCSCYSVWFCSVRVRLILSMAGGSRNNTVIDLFCDSVIYAGTDFILDFFQLSPFVTMVMTLFAWISSSSLAYIYGQDGSFHEEYLSINGREHPCQIVFAEGRSSEIKQTLAGCLTRALPGLVADLRLPTPISSGARNGTPELGMFQLRL